MLYPEGIAFSDLSVGGLQDTLDQPLFLTPLHGAVCGIQTILCDNVPELFFSESIQAFDEFCFVILNHVERIENSGIPTISSPLDIRGFV